MAVFQAFFDAGGDAEDSNLHVLSVAGWVAPEARWRRLEREWRAICDREGVSGLHMREFAHSEGEYAAWRNDEPRRRRFLGDLAKAIKRHTNRDFSQDAFLDGYRAVDAQFEFHERIGHPYSVCALMCINRVREWMAKTHPNDDVMFVFEKGDAHQGEIIDLLKRDKIDLGIDPIFMEKRWVVGNTLRTVPALECADFLAYEHHKCLSDLYLKSKGTARGSLWTLTGEGEYFNTPGRGRSVVDGLFFETAARGFSLPRRPGVQAAPIPRELETVKRIMGDNFHGVPVREIPIAECAKEPLAPIRRKS